jgi:predicted nucleic acid-binding protein
MAGERTFVDTNVLLYAYDKEAGAKHLVAGAAVAELWKTRTGAISTQVLQEFAVNAKKKAKAPSEAIRRVVETYRAWPVHRPDVDDIVRALDTAESDQISFWDALILVSAARLGATRLYTEDLNHGQTIAGVRIVNPFRA